MTAPASSSSTTSPAAAVVLLSGGLDSATLLAMATHEPRTRRTVHALTFDYGQRHRHEITSARQVASELGAASHAVVPMDLRWIGGSALTADIEVPKHDPATASSNQAQTIPITYVPARNLIFLSLALGYAEARGAAELWIGVNAVDYSGYPDCRPEFLASFQQTADLATRAGVQDHLPIHVVAPLVGMSKAQIIRTGTDLGVDFAMTHSCYDPVGAWENWSACGGCESCRLRAEGFKAAGVPDPTKYARA
jgi:7-cyano-7-deazaguanine synthase